MPGVIIAAPASGSGKTTLALELMRHLRNTGLRVAPFKIGPDYIDPAFHAAACGRASVNLDGWAMRPETVTALARDLGDDADFIVGEGVMGLFDGTVGGEGSTADIAVRTGWPIVLLVDAAAQGASAAALVHGFASFRDDVKIAAVVFNRVGGARHADILTDAMKPLDIPVLGCLPRDASLTLPERHLGLVQASEQNGLEDLLDRMAASVAEHLDIAGLRDLAREAEFPANDPGPALPPLAQRIAVAQDDAFRFAYPHVLEGWWRDGVEIVPFSPLADETPDAAAGAVYLPGGYPELHGARLAANRAFMDGLRAATARGAAVFGECGGYMVLGAGLIDADGARHEMAGLLAVETSFAERKLHLGYRAAELIGDGPLGAAGAAFRGHEFHYATILREDEGDKLFRIRDARGGDLGAAGLRRGAVAGSFIHLIDRA